MCVWGCGGVGCWSVGLCVCARTGIQVEDKDESEFNTVKVRTFLQNEDKIHVLA